MESPCSVCNNADCPSETLVCDMCTCLVHANCAGVEHVPRGFWYCDACEALISKGEVLDITVDKSLTKSLFEGVVPTDIDDAACV